MMNQAQIRSAWAVYKIAVSEMTPNRTTFVGCCRLEDVAKFPDAWEYEAFRQSVTPTDLMTLTILAVVQTEDEATAIQSSAVTVDNVWINLNSPRTPPPAVKSTGRAVICIDSAERFPSARKAALAHNVTPSAMSKHLAGILHSVGGLRFRWDM